jgi:5-enolpyruvylshikimate-3-phosphate synthase
MVRDRRIPASIGRHGRRGGDHRLVMAFALVGLGAERPTTIRGADAVSVSYPDFARDLAALTP